MSVRARRLDNEWALLDALAKHNPDLLEVRRRETLPDAEVFHVILHRTSAMSLGPPPQLLESASHAVAFRYPLYYPSVPIEAFLATPVFHPNVHPENGFVCLWDRFSSGDTIIEAVAKLQKVITWELWNDRTEHVMQPDALQSLGIFTVPLRCERVTLSCFKPGERGYVKVQSFTRRLTEP
jgi:ubiquitin-protein ligase